MRIVQLEALRGFSALYVALHHTFYASLLSAGSKFAILFKYGELGVMIFFLISGFVIKLSYERSADKSFKNYFFKRFFRIYIPLIIIFIANYLIQLLNNEGIHGFSIAQVFTNLFMLQTRIVDSIFTPLFHNMPLWSLSFEWWFYMIFFLCMKYFKEKSSIIIYCIGFIASVISLFYISFFIQVFSYIVIWWFGVDMAKLYLSGEKISFRNLKYKIIVLISIVLLYKLTSRNFHSQYFILSLITIFIGLVWYRFKWIFFDKTIGLFLPLASISYAVYISHWFIIGGPYLNFVKNDILRYILYFLICFLFSYLVERILYPKINKMFMKIIYPNKF